MPKTREYTIEQFKKAIVGSMGITANVAKNLGCSYPTAHRRIKKSKILQEAMDLERLDVINMAENVVFNDIAAGSVKTAQWLLERKGKYNTTNNHEGNINIQVSYDDPND